MIDPCASTPEKKNRGVVVAAVLLWLVIQLGALGASAARVPLWARTPEPVQRVAGAQMLAVQIIASAMLFPWLMPTVGTSFFIVLTSAPMLQLAGMLSGVAWSGVAPAWGYLCLWLVALAYWSVALQSVRARLCGMAIATSLALGVPLLRYLAMEFRDRTELPFRGLEWLDPAGSAVTQLHPDSRDAAGWFTVCVILVGGAAVAIWTHRRRVSTSYPQA